MGESKFTNSGYKKIKSSADVNSYKPRIKSSDLPPVVDLRKEMTAVEDQGQLSSCVANATAGAYEYLVKQFLKEKAYDVSRLFIYYNARMREGGPIQDEGTGTQYAIEGLQKLGACSEDQWPYDSRRVNTKPADPCYNAAAQFKIKEAESVPTELRAWKKCLAEGNPIIFGTVLFDSFDQCNERKGVVPMPTKDDVTRGEHGAHAMLCVGYSDYDEVFIVRNSWGADWGEKGYCYIPYNYLMNKEINLDDSWIIRSVGKIPDSNKTWITQDTSVIDNGNGYQGEINTPIIAGLLVGLVLEIFEGIYDDKSSSDFETHALASASVEEYEVEYEEEDEYVEEEDDDEDSEEEEDEGTEDEDGEEDEDDKEEEDDEEEDEDDEEEDDEEEDEDDEEEDDEEDNEDEEEDEEEEDEEEEDEEEEDEEEEEEDEEEEEEEEEEDEDTDDDDDDN